MVAATTTLTVVAVAVGPDGWCGYSLVFADSEVTTMAGSVVPAAGSVVVVMLSLKAAWFQHYPTATGGRSSVAFAAAVAVAGDWSGKWNEVAVAAVVVGGDGTEGGGVGCWD